MTVLQGLRDRVRANGKASGDVWLLHGKKKRRLVTVYGDNLVEMRRNKNDVTRRLAVEYQSWWFDKGGQMTDCMRSAFRVLMVLGKVDFARVVPKSTIRAMMKRGIITDALDIGNKRFN